MADCPQVMAPPKVNLPEAKPKPDESLVSQQPEYQQQQQQEEEPIDVSRRHNRDCKCDQHKCTISDDSSVSLSEDTVTMQPVRGRQGAEYIENLHR